MACDDSGHISLQAFIACCKEIERGGNGWTMVTKPPHAPFLKKTLYNTDEATIKHVTCVKNDNTSEDDAELRMDYKPDSYENVIYECHVVFSESYGNPVLYFSAHSHSGKMLTLDEVWKKCECGHETTSHRDDKWGFVTQAEHPVLLVPYYQLHPCHTSDFMAPLVNVNKNNGERVNDLFNYVFAWLSIVLPAIGLKPD